MGYNVCLLYLRNIISHIHSEVLIEHVTDVDIWWMPQEKETIGIHYEIASAKVRGVQA